MKIYVNGEVRDCQAGSTLAELLAELKLSCSRVAVERNREIVPPQVYETTELQEGDRLEVVGFVGGG